MKKFNQNILVFIVAVVMLITGFGRMLVSEVFSASKDFCIEIASGNKESFKTFTKRIEKTSSENLRYHSQLMNLNSLKEKYLGTRIIVKNGEQVVKTDIGSLAVASAQPLSEKQADAIAEKVENLKNVAQENGAEFLYVAAPAKAYYGGLPQNVTDYTKENYDLLMQALQNRRIPSLDFSGMLNAESYYLTDHHWKIRSAFEANRTLCETLNENYGFTYNPENADIDRFKVETYEDWFLGSYGKKVGIHFSSEVDDFELITPAFETDFTELLPLENKSREGSFSETLIYQDKLEKGYYNKNQYAAYSGGDFRLQIMKNNQLPEGKKVLMVRDSFACALAPFFALQTSELHLCDMRNFDYFTGEKLNMKEYIEELKPDYVVVLYNGPNGTYDFF